jgi:hypothetical protein
MLRGLNGKYHSFLLLEELCENQHGKLAAQHAMVAHHVRQSR